MKPGLFYLAGPYSSGPDKEYERHRDAADYLLEHDFCVYSPICETHHWHLKYPHTHNEWLHRDLIMVGRCDGLIRLPGESKGSDIEVQQAKMLGLPVWAGETPVDDFIEGRPPTFPKRDVIPEQENENILDEAKRLTTRDRNDTYGHPLDDFRRTAKMWSALFGIEITPEKAQLAMMCVKISRLVKSPNHRDSVVDIAGYANCYDMTVIERKKRDLSYAE